MRVDLKALFSIVQILLLKQHKMFHQTEKKVLNKLILFIILWLQNKATQ